MKEIELSDRTFVLSKDVPESWGKDLQDFALQVERDFGVVVDIELSKRQEKFIKSPFWDFYDLSVNVFYKNDLILFCKMETHEVNKELEDVYIFIQENAFPKEVMYYLTSTLLNVRELNSEVERLNRAYSQVLDLTWGFVAHYFPDQTVMVFFPYIELTFAPQIKSIETDRRLRLSMCNLNKGDLQDVLGSYPERMLISIRTENDCVALERTKRSLMLDNLTSNFDSKRKKS